ncbi:flagellar biosynthetic protein FliP [Candidatus Thiodiazotropha endoloripes]|uniref:flagellar type III secretion system pore protein FliP n=1 Tax=Candidatus Thiodiazotropha endoloripes TaxID=1818881 RepID=UPI00083DE8CF|nr:flagellar type III secretion system pore protein FliP [Candidatus Thiodiazotropha endoloripes]ODB85628.1 flagellar biosynthetic protein FliP [Candidatus Thiodiazotropha endoloripes]
MKLTKFYQTYSKFLYALLGFGVFLLFPSLLYAADIQLPGIGININDSTGDSEEVATAIKIILGITVLSLAPAILIMMTSFTRIIVVLAILRHAFGMQQTPPNTVLISLALFLTLFNMLPTLNIIEENALVPYQDGKLSTQAAFQEGMSPIRDFMIRQTREEDLALMVEVSGNDMPQTIEDVSNLQVIPAFMLSELKAAFQIGFVIFLPFVLIDIVVASILMSMGMLMVPPMMISLPIKILMFVLIDGWNLVVHSLLGSFV